MGKGSTGEPTTEPDAASMTQLRLGGTQFSVLQPNTFRSSSTAPRIVAITTTITTTTPTASRLFSTSYSH